MSNTFDGVVGEFPFLCVDRFDSSASVFLLTHCHIDHLVGIQNKAFTGPIYCSVETKELLKVRRDDPNFLKLMITLDYNVPTRLDIPQKAENAYGRVQVTLIKAYHCLGACMFLVENENGAILITGDVRAEKWWCDKLQNVPPLFPYITGLKTLDNIYFDSTFGYRGEPYIEIPPNNSGVYTAINLLKEYPKDDPEVCFAFLDTVLGFEQAWAFILSFFRASLRINNKKLEELIRLAAKFDRVNGPPLMLALEKGQRKEHNKHGVLYAVSRGERENINGSVLVRIRQCINFNIMDFAGVFCPLSLASMSLQEKKGLRMIHETKMGNRVYEARGRSWILPHDGSELLPMDVKLVFSRHSSYSETRNFISMFRPRQVYPCWYSKEAWLNGFSMKRLFGKHCSGDMFNFDNIMLSQYGFPITEIMSRDAATIDRWDVDSCKQEEAFVSTTLEENKELQIKGVRNKNIALINLRKVVRVPVFRQNRSVEEQEFVMKRAKDFRLQKIVEGRHDTSYQKFIEAQQQLYYKRHNLPQYKRDYESTKYLSQFSSTLGGSSDYDSDSCSSSLDLAAIATRSTSPAEIVSIESVSSDPHNEERLDILNPNRKRSRFKPSFVKSSFDAFEESMACKKVHKCLTKPIYC